MSSSQFDPKRYYRIFNPVSNSTLTLGHNATEPPPPLALIPIGYFPSENWQFFYDDGVYFIRNRDYGSRYQLGLNSSDQSTPSMMDTGSGLGMQWNITTGSGDNGVWELKNLFVAQTNVLALGSGFLNMKVPVMNTDQTAGKWIIGINPSASNVSDSMMSPFPSPQTSIKPSSTSISTSSLAAQPSEAQPSESLSSGAIAGIVVGCVVAALIILSALLFFWRSRRRATAATKYTDVPASPQQKDGILVKDQHENQKLPELESNSTERAELDAARQASELPAYRQG